MFSPHSLRYKSPTGFLVASAIILCTLVWPNRLAAPLFTGPSLAQSETNSIDDVEFFVRQQYRDFLNREPDAPGLAFWVNNITMCGADPACVEVKRIDTSAAFFLSIEFQTTGFLAIRTHRAAFGNLVGKPVPLTFRSLLTDGRRIGAGVIVGTPNWPETLEANKIAYFNEFVTRAAFIANHPTGQTAEQYVDALFLRAGVTPTSSERQTAIAAFGAGDTAGRAAALRSVAESQTLNDAEFRKAFVLMQYYGYLRRNPDDAPESNLDFAGYSFWLGKLNQFNGDFRAAEMVKAFIVSLEYRSRFILGEQELVGVSREVSSGFEQVRLPGVMEIELLDNAARPSMPFTLSYVSSPVAASLFRNDLSARGLPPIVADGALRISAPQAIPGFMGVRVRVPDEILANLTPGLEPRLYIFVADGSEFEESGEFMTLDSRYNPATGMLSAPLSGKYFFEDSSTQIRAAGSTQILPAAVRNTVKILVSVAEIASRKVPVTGSLTTPSSNTVEARVRDTINISGTFNIRVPVALQFPTAGGTLPTSEGKLFNPPIHSGIDFAASDGDPVFAAQEGTVTEVIADQKVEGFTRCDPTIPKGGGLVVKIKHLDDSVTGYAHLLTGSVTLKPGDQVAAGQQIAQADHTGGVCPRGPAGAHLHFSYTVDGQRSDPTNFFSNNPQAVEQAWLDQLSFVTVVNGTPVEATRKQVTQRNFTYNAPLDLSALPNIQAGQTYPLEISVQTKDGASMRVFSGELKVLGTALQAVLTWDKADTDVDLHVRDSLNRESWFGNLCGIPDGCLDHDDVDGFGPETFSLPQFEPGVTYRVFLHYFSDHDNGPTTATVKVFVNNELVDQKSVTLSDDQVADIGIYPQSQQIRGSQDVLKISTGLRKRLKIRKK